MMTAFLAVIRRDLSLALRQGSDSLMVVCFFVIAALLFPFGIGPEASLLERVAPGILLVMALLAALLSLDRLFQADWEDGSLELIALSPLPLGWLVVGKVVAHWLTTGLPLVVAAPVLGLLLNLPEHGFAPLIGALILATPILSLVGAVGAGLVLGARRGGVLLSLLVLPLYIPALIFGAGAVDAALQGLEPGPHLMILAALLIASLALCPFAAAAALHQAIE